MTLEDRESPGARDRDRIATVVLPMRNEAAHIAACLDSILQNDLPDHTTLEVLVLDGASTDRSAEIVTAYAARDSRIRLLPNPRRLQAVAFNRGIAAARGDYVLRMDAHSLYPANYIAECLKILEQTGAENVGGIQQATGQSWISAAIAAALSSRLAVGDAKYRYATTAGFTDTVYLGCWRTETLRKLGGMRENWAVNEDYELNVRLRASGGRVYLSPTIRSTYFVRASLASLIRQYGRYGLWKVRTLMEHSHSLRGRQVVPPLFVLSIPATWPLIHWFGWWGAAHLAVYALVNLGVSGFTAARSRWAYLPVLPLVFLLIHLSWGCGFLAGLVYWPVRLRSNSRPAIA